LKTEGSYKIASVRPSVPDYLGNHSNNFSEILHEVGHIQGQKNVPSGFFIFSVIFRHFAKTAKNGPKMRFLALFSKTAPTIFQTNLTKSVEIWILAIFLEVMTSNVVRNH